MKKFNFLILIIISLIFIIISSKAFSSSKCNLFFDEIKSNYEKYEPYAPKWQFVDFGFQLRKDWNSSKDDWEYYNYYFIEKSKNIFELYQSNNKTLQLYLRSHEDITNFAAFHWYEKTLGSYDKIYYKINSSSYVWNIQRSSNILLESFF